MGIVQGDLTFDRDARNAVVAHFFEYVVEGLRVAGYDEFLVGRKEVMVDQVEFIEGLFKE